MAADFGPSEQTRRDWISQLEADSGVRPGAGSGGIVHRGRVQRRSRRHYVLSATT